MHSELIEHGAHNVSSAVCRHAAIVLLTIRSPPQGMIQAARRRADLRRLAPPPLCRMEKFFEDDRHHPERDVKRGLRSALRDMHEAARDIDELSLIDGERPRLPTEGVSAVAHPVGPHGEDAALVFQTSSASSPRPAA
jgi:hypothetical protein